jgi:aspartate racemase
LEQAGAGVIGIACNTSYCPPIYDVIQGELARRGSMVNLIHMPLETVLFVKERHPEIQRIGLMTTNGSYRQGLYKSLFDRVGLEVIMPDVRFQEEVIHKIIYDPRFGIKSVPAGITPEARKLMEDAIHFFMQKKADAVLLGCTELSVFGLSEFGREMSVIDPLDVLARALIREARSGRKVFQVE